MQKLRYAVIGTGGIANSHFHDVTAKPDVEVVGLSDVAAANLEAASKRFPKAVAEPDYEAMLAKAEPDVVSVCTPNRFHKAQVLAALKVGAHVICEKPMAMNLAEAKEMESARAKAGKLGYINFSYRNVMSFRFARELIASGELGRISRVHAVYLQSFLGAPGTLYSWRNDLDIAGWGALGDLGVHMIDAVRFITGLDYERVVGLALTAIPEKLDAQGKPHKVTTDTNSAFIAQLSEGVAATFETTQSAPGYGNHHRIEVSGEHGTLIVLSDKPNEIEMTVGKSINRYATWATSIPVNTVPTDFCARQKTGGPGLLIDAVRGEKVEFPTFADGVAAQKVLEGIRESTRTNAWCSL